MGDDPHDPAAVEVFFGAETRETPWLEIDRRLDDGNLDRGRLRRRPGGFLYVVEF